MIKVGLSIFDELPWGTTMTLWGHLSVITIYLRRKILQFIVSGHEIAGDLKAARLAFIVFDVNWETTGPAYKMCQHFRESVGKYILLLWKDFSYVGVVSETEWAGTKSLVWFFHY